LRFRQKRTIFGNGIFFSRSLEACKQKYDELNDLDICSPVFNFPRAVALVKEQQDRLVCDVLLDQLILPGVGNIIKNEVLLSCTLTWNIDLYKYLSFAFLS
jgi:endonuclease VIII-like 3